MSVPVKKLRLLAAFAALISLAFAVSCRGFFVNPTLESIDVGPSNQSIVPGGTLQMVATGHYDDHDSDVTGEALWTSSDTTVATVGNKTGKVTAAATIANPPASTTITATIGTISNTATVSVCPSVTSMTLTPSTTNVVASQNITFTVQAKFSGSSTNHDVTDQVTWNISNTSVIPSISDGAATVSSSATSGTSTTVSATLCGGTSNVVTITVQ